MQFDGTTEVEGDQLPQRRVLMLTLRMTYSQVVGLSEFSKAGLGRPVGRGKTALMYDYLVRANHPYMVDYMTAGAKIVG